MSEPTKRCDGSCPLIQDDGTVYVPEKLLEEARTTIRDWGIANGELKDRLAEAQAAQPITVAPRPAPSRTGLSLWVRACSRIGGMGA